MRENLAELDEMAWQDYQLQQAEERMHKHKRSSDDSLSSSFIRTRIKRSTKYKRYYAYPKIRSNVGSDKLTWDGMRSSYPAFSADLEGTMLRLGAGYLFDRKVMQAYEQDGAAFIKSDQFWEEH